MNTIRNPVPVIAIIFLTESEITKRIIYGNSLFSSSICRSGNAKGAKFLDKGKAEFIHVHLEE